MSKSDAPQEHVTEGKATILFTKNEAFYNPVQQFNRDLSITILSIFSESLRKKEEERAAKKGKPCEFKGVTVLEALAATGLRSVRYALEAEGVEKIVANDIDPSAIEAMKRNFEFNKIPEGKVQLSQGDAMYVPLAHLHTLPPIFCLHPFPLRFIPPFLTLGTHGVLPPVVNSLLWSCAAT